MPRGLLYCVATLLILALAQADEATWGSANSCPSGYEKLTTTEACRAALDYVDVTGDSFNEEENESDWPSGCYYCLLRWDEGLRGRRMVQHCEPG